MTSGLVNASFSLPKGQAVKMIFFAPCSAPDSPGFFFVFYLFTFAFEGGNFIRNAGRGFCKKNKLQL